MMSLKAVSASHLSRMRVVCSDGGALVRGSLRRRFNLFSKVAVQRDDHA